MENPIFGPNFLYSLLRPKYKKNGSSVLPDVFWDILRLKVGPLQWLGPLLSHRKYFDFITSLLDWES
jgi:hypothetical protein